MVAFWRCIHVIEGERDLGVVFKRPNKDYEYAKFEEFGLWGGKPLAPHDYNEDTEELKKSVKRLGDGGLGSFLTASRDSARSAGLTNGTLNLSFPTPIIPTLHRDVVHEALIRGLGVDLLLPEDSCRLGQPPFRARRDRQRQHCFKAYDHGEVLGQNLQEI